MSEETLGDLFFKFVGADNPDDKQRLGLRFANELDKVQRRLDLALHVLETRGKHKAGKP